MEKRMTIWRVQLFALMRVLLSGFRVRLVNPNGGYRSVGKKSSGLLSRLGGIGVILLLACAAVSVMFMLGTSFYTLVEPLHLLGLDWMYMSLVWIVCAFVMLFGTVFLAKAMLYEAKDNARLLVMPISPTVILCARMLSLYLLNLIWGAFVLCPALVCRFWLIGFSMGILIRSILIYLLIGLFSLALSGLLGWVLARISAHIRNKSLVTVVLSLAFIGAYYYCVGTGFSRVMELLLNESHAVAEALGAFAPLYHLGMASVSGEAVSVAVSAATLLVPFVLVSMLLSATFGATATASGSSRLRKGAGYVGRYRVRTVERALLLRENARLLSSSVYLLNAGIGVAFLVAGAIYMLIKYDTLAPMVAMLGQDMLLALFLGGAGMLLSTVLFTAPSVSLDAKTLWVLRSMPVPPMKILCAKWRLHLLWCTVPLLMLSGVGCMYLLRYTPSAQMLDGGRVLSGAELALSVVLIFVLPQLCSVLCSGVGLLLGLRFPNLQWTTEAQVVKQGMAVLTAMVSNLALVGIPALSVWYLRTDISVPLLLLAWTAVFAVGIYAVYRVLLCWGVAAFERLS